MKKIISTFYLILVFFAAESQNFNGFALYNTQGSSTTYLVDENQNIAHSWSMSTDCNYTVALKKNGNLIRGTTYNNNILNGAAYGGRVQEIDPNGNVVWDYIYSSANYLSHHDLTLIGDNVLLTAWEVKTSSEVTAAGYTGNVGSSGIWPTHFIELEPDGNGGANIVWEWHIWDHLCQDVDPNKPNYVSNISDHPELIDINMIQGGGGGPGGGGGDWFHVNGVDYNEELDQIAFSSRFASEIYIIDHSTTTLQAASHAGGNSGMGGDILYRWGNPSNYGIPGTQVIPNAVHDVRWIENDGRPYGGYLQIFNNSGGGNGQSTIDEIKTPWDSINNVYLRSSGQAFTPTSFSNRYTCMYSSPGQSASNRMSNGNIYVNASGGQQGAGVMYEVDSTGALIWGPHAAIGSNNGSQKGFRYECNYPGILALEQFMNTATTSCFPLDSWDCDGNGKCFDPGTGNGQYSSLVQCQANCFSTAITELRGLKNLLIYPNPSRDIFNISFIVKKQQDLTISIFNLLGENIMKKEIEQFIGEYKDQINLHSYSNGVYFFKIETQAGVISKKIILD